MGPLNLLKGYKVSSYEICNDLYEPSTSVEPIIHVIEFILGQFFQNRSEIKVLHDNGDWIFMVCIGVKVIYTSLNVLWSSCDDCTLCQSEEYSLLNDN